MQFNREIQRLLIGLLVAFGVVTLAAAYWAVSGPDTLLLRDDNPRLFEAEASIIRGDIVDRYDEPLVISVQADNGFVSRNFLHPETNSVLGYYSLRYGVGGAEAAYNTILRGDDLEQDLAAYVEKGVLHQPQRGSAVRLSLDFAVQQAAVQALGEHTGAVVVLSVPTGEVLALVSLPTFDPNQLDQNWNTLIEAPEQPFFNRALQGQYQPGGVLQTPLMTAALIAGIPIGDLQEGATQPVSLETVTLSCTVALPEAVLTLRDAYIYGCPSPFANLYTHIGAQSVQSTFDLFQLGTPFEIPGFLPEINGLVTPTPLPDTGMTLENALGQGTLTVSPLDVAVMTAAILNDGNATPPVMALAVRKPDESEWIPVNGTQATIPVTTSETSRQLQELMRMAVTSGNAMQASREGMTIGGHASLAYAGDTSHTWFNGFVVTGAGQGIVIALVLENNDDPSEAAAIGGTILETAFNRTVSTP